MRKKCFTLMMALILFFVSLEYATIKVQAAEESMLGYTNSNARGVYLAEGTSGLTKVSQYKVNVMGCTA